MSDNQIVATTPEQVTDATVDQYFSSQGQEGVAELAPEEGVETQETQSENVSQQSEETKGNQEEQTENEESADSKESDIGYNLNMALKQEREKRKGINKELENTKGQLQQLQEMVGRLIGPDNGENENQIKYEDDPIEYLRQSQEKILQQLQEKGKQEEAIKQQQQYENAQRQLIGSYQNAATQYRKENPEFDNAYKFLVEGRMKEYTAAGYSEQEATMMLQEDELAIVSKSLTDEANPAERIFQLAKARGYQGPQQSQADSVKSKLDKLEQGQRLNKSLSDAQGGQGNKDLSLGSLSFQDIDKMSDADLNAVFEKMQQQG